MLPDFTKLQPTLLHILVRAGKVNECKALEAQSYCEADLKPDVQIPHIFNGK